MCFNPVYLASKGMFVSCGKCFECVQSKSFGWAARIMVEASNYDIQPCMITLTYSDKYIKHEQEELVRDYQLFLKRVRKSCGKLRFILSMEYGPLHGREHFHFIIFGLRLNDLQFFKKIDDRTLYRSPFIESKWNYGFSSVEPISSVGAAKYVTLYMQRRKSSKRGFMRMSLKPAIGCINLDKKVDWLRTGKYVVEGNSYSLPKVFLNAFEKLGYIKEVVRIRAKKYYEFLQRSKVLFRELQDGTFARRRAIKVNFLKNKKIFLDNQYCLC